MIQLEKHRSGPRNLGLVVSVVSGRVSNLAKSNFLASIFCSIPLLSKLVTGTYTRNSSLNYNLYYLGVERTFGSWIGELKQVWRDKGRKKWNSKLSVISIVPGHESTSQDGNYELWSSMRWERRHRASSLTCQKHDSTSYHDRGGWLSLADSTTQK